MRRLAGYTDRISARPGDRVGFKVSADPDVARYRADLVRLWCVDDHRDGPGVEEEVIPAGFSGVWPARQQPVRLGSGMEVRGTALTKLQHFALRLAFLSTREDDRPQTLVATDQWRAALVSGSLLLEAGGERATLSVPVSPNQWWQLTLVCDGAELRLSAGCRSGGRNTSASLPAPVGGFADLPLLTFACDPAGGDCFNGKIATPQLWDGPLAQGASFASWDLSADMGSLQVPDRGTQGLTAQLINMPLRAVTGPLWDGSVQDWHVNPTHYDAIHFHDDDLGDCGWQDDFVWDVPEGLQSGVYAARLLPEGGGDAEYIPLFLRPSAPAVDAVFLVSTCTYMAYANYRVMNRSNLYEMYLGQVPEVVESDLYLNLHPELGDSLYTTHSDGSGMAISSRLRPILNMRPNSTLSAFSDDGWIWSFLRHEGLACDMLTDEDLDREGVAALAGYRLVVTGNHPEYVTTRMWDALLAHRAAGGSLLYLGGNGFYWRVAFHTEVPGVMELRRTEDGSRPWESAPGEYYHAFTGEYGGMWRRCGRPPQTLLGIGFSASGFDISSPYRRLPAAADPRVTFLFEGVPEGVIGAEGLAGGGAGGQEIDRHDIALGSPRHALVVARSDGHTEEMMISKEDMPASNYMIGAPDNPLCRADLTFFETGAGGAVVSTGSIAWAAALPVNGFDNPVARLTANAFRRLADPTPFPLPDGAMP
jgi:N,N-dimethylformamidase